MARMRIKTRKGRMKLELETQGKDTPESSAPTVESKDAGHRGRKGRKRERTTKEVRRTKTKDLFTC